MGDAKVIPFDDDARGRRAGAGRARPRGRKQGPAGASGSGPGADSASGTGTGSGSGASASGRAGEHGPLSSVPEAAQAPAEDEAAAEDRTPETGSEGPAKPSDTPSEAPGEGPPAPEPPSASSSPSLADALGGVADRLLGGSWERKVASGLAFLRRRVTGEYEVDEFGYDAELTDQVLMSLLRPLYETYFRVEVKGVENIPAEGGALVVSNHSGTLPIDALMTQVAVHDHHPAGRHLRLLGADLVFMLPLVNDLARKAGHTLACAEDAQLLLERGEVVGVMPEGFKGLGKPFAERYKLQRFGRGGFVATALRTKVPIIPCSVVGAEEIYPMIGNSRTLARVLGIPYFPLTPTFPWLGPLGMIPLPTKWTIQFGEPIPTDDYPPEAADDPMLVFNLTDQVRETIQHTLYELLVERRSVFF
ncbi:MULTISPECIES: lysophospholipid acyltransferase family protein [unclassified Streptomyces]|uniref:lysophospholipid acyltransferase family protein n=1 Tax=unclassified Streptomyces TaxID=2593676 RepID=UPI002E27EAD1|nr:lysophospholipid acyltransferase family protein [Streptomyces sp. NBC_00223]